MTEKQLRDLIRKWQARLDLDGWRIAVRFSDTVRIDDSEVFMRAHRATYYRRATIEVSNYALKPETLPDCLEKDLLQDGIITQEENVEVSVVHELLHLGLRDIMETSDLIREHLAPPAVSVWDGAWRRAEEDFVENLAIALVRNWNS